MNARSPSARALRLAALALLAGGAAGLAATGDIEASYREGRIASPWSAAAVPAADAPPRAAAEALDPDLAYAHGFALAAQRGAADAADCRAIAAELRPGCEDYVRSRTASATGAPERDFIV
jgi:hypothetical protein